MRKLHLIPIVHSAADLGLLAPAVADVKSKLMSDDSFDMSTANVQIFWSTLDEAIRQWDVDYPSLLVFQDALPVPPEHNEFMVEKIVADLAQQGSQNHRILKWLVDRGARLVGTESPELLMAEYELMKQTLEAKLDSDDEGLDVGPDTQRASELLIQRDKFIASRVNSLLDENSIGIIFLGLMHRLDEELESDIEVFYPFGKPSQSSILSS